MGGAAAHIAAERQPERFDGVLGLCGSAGASPGLEDITFMFVAAAYAAASPKPTTRDLGHRGTDRRAHTASPT